MNCSAALALSKPVISGMVTTKLSTAPTSATLKNVQLTLLVGAYAQRYHLGAAVKKTLGETVGAWRDYPDNVLPLPHPSWRNTGWLKRNPWFEIDLLPELRRRVSSALR